MVNKCIDAYFGFAADLPRHPKNRVRGHHQAEIEKFRGIVAREKLQMDID